MSKEYNCDLEGSFSVKFFMILDSTQQIYKNFPIRLYELLHILLLLFLKRFISYLKTVKYVLISEVQLNVIKCKNSACG